jgi:hypothetical protein
VRLDKQTMVCVTSGWWVQLCDIWVLQSPPRIKEKTPCRQNSVKRTIYGMIFIDVFHPMSKCRVEIL